MAMSETETETPIRLFTLRQLWQRDLAHLVSLWTFERRLRADRKAGKGPEMTRLSPQREAVSEEDWQEYLRSWRRAGK
jgi:hypothetical protein